MLKARAHPSQGPKFWLPHPGPYSTSLNRLECSGNYSTTLNNMKLVHWPLMGWLLHLVQRGGDWAGLQPAQTPPRSTKCNSPPINGQCRPTNQYHRIAFYCTLNTHYCIVSYRSIKG